MSSIQNWTQSAWQAHGAIAAAVIGPPRLPEFVALPGAKAAVPHDRLAACQDADMGEHEIVERVNDRWVEENAERLTQHKRWVAGYANAVEELAKHAAEARAEEMRKRAAFEQMLREREED